MFFIVSIIYFLIFSLTQWFVPTPFRPRLWRLGVKRHNELILKIARIRLKLHNVPTNIEQSAILISNHRTSIDGFIYFSLFGPDVIPVTAPTADFPFPFNYVFKNMGAIDVTRDKLDERRYSESYSKKDAIAKMIETAQQKIHLLIFPEGHIERTQQLYYLHTGCIRTSISSQQPIALFGITGTEYVFPDTLSMRPGTIHIHFGGIIEPPKISRALPYRKAVIEMREKVEQTFVKILPHRYIPSYISCKQPQRICAFIDIDGTLYEGIFEKDCIMYAMKKGLISRSRAFYILFLLLGECVHLIPHITVMRLSHTILHNISPQKLYKLAHEYFTQIGIHKLNDSLLPIILNHQQKGHTVIFVTEIIDSLAHIFNDELQGNGVIGTHLTSKKNAYTGTIDCLMYAEEKARAVHEYAKQHNINLKTSYAYGNMLADRYILESVGHAIAVNPQYSLKKLAHKKGWKIVY